MYYQETEEVNNDRMQFAVFVAVALHVLLILGVGFEAQQSRSFNRQIKVTLTTQASKIAPTEAEHIASADQLGSGDEAQFNEVSSQTPPAPPTARRR